MGYNGINLVKKKYVWSEITKTSLNIYKWVLSDFNNKYLKGFIGLNANKKMWIFKNEDKYSIRESKPVIVSELGGSADLIKKSKSGISIEEEDFKIFYMNTEYLLKNTSYAKK